MKQRGLFIIGTDTDVGKTFVTALLGGLLQYSNHAIGLLKPIASGAKQTEDGALYSVDARELLRLSRWSLDREEEVNPVRLLGEYSPKVAAEKMGITVNMPNVLQHIKDVVNRHDYTLIEGAGGITTPFSPEYRLDQVIRELGYPVLLVTDGRLGSINRVLLTASYIKMLDVPLVGMIVNDIDNTEPYLLKTNCDDMALYTGRPILGCLSRYEGPRDVDSELAWAIDRIHVNPLLTAWEAAYAK